MRRAVVGSVVLVLALMACNNDVIYVDDDVPAAPRALAATYYAGAVTVTWELAPAWNGEAFRVYSRRITDSSWFFIAEVTSCVQEFCSYQDLNVTPGQTYEYLVSAVSSTSGVETDSDYSVEVFVPEAIAPPIPNATYVIALDNANYVMWRKASRAAGDFSHYKIYLDDGSEAFLLGETDSEGFLDLLAGNGSTYAYFVTAVDTDGHESDGSVLGEGTPRPDFTGEWIYDFFDVPASSGFRFAEDESILPIVDGSSVDRHFRLETDVNGWWLVPGPGTSVISTGYSTTALKCGVAADAGCVDIVSAPLSGYVAQDVQLFTQESYVLQVVGNDAQIHYGVIRVDLLGLDQNGDGIMIFDWAYQLQAGNPNLVEAIGG
jgi:hypothetical protein